MTSSGTRGPRPMPSTTGGGTWSYQPPKSSQVTNIAVEDHAGLCMTALTTEETKFCAGCVGFGGRPDCAAWPGVTKLILGSWLAFASAMVCCDGTGGAFLVAWMYCGAFHTGAWPEYLQLRPDRVASSRIDRLLWSGCLNPPPPLSSRSSSTSLAGDRQPFAWIV